MATHDVYVHRIIDYYQMLKKVYHQLKLSGIHIQRELDEFQHSISNGRIIDRNTATDIIRKLRNHGNAVIEMNKTQRAELAITEIQSFMNPYELPLHMEEVLHEMNVHQNSDSYNLGNTLF